MRGPIGMCCGEDGFWSGALGGVGIYGRCGKRRDARKVFEEMCERDVVAVTVVIRTLMDCGMVEEAVGVFGEVGEVGEKDRVCWIGIIDGLVTNGEGVGGVS
ncbi:hypothetical protein Droror1_Dr00016561 [Drosera rotundifolia]